MTGRKRQTRHATLADYRTVAGWFRSRRDLAMRLEASGIVNADRLPGVLDRATEAEAGYDEDTFLRVTGEVAKEIQHLYERGPRALKRWQVEALVVEALNRRILELLEPDWTEAV